jgi:hypothetical protein
LISAILAGQVGAVSRVIGALPHRVADATIVVAVNNKGSLFGHKVFTSYVGRLFVYGIAQIIIQWYVNPTFELLLYIIIMGSLGKSPHGIVVYMINVD